MQTFDKMNGSSITGVAIGRLSFLSVDSIKRRRAMYHETPVRLDRYAV